MIEAHILHLACQLEANMARRHAPQFNALMNFNTVILGAAKEITEGWKCGEWVCTRQQDKRLEFQGTRNHAKRDGRRIILGINDEFCANRQSPYILDAARARLVQCDTRRRVRTAIGEQQKIKVKTLTAVQYEMLALNAHGLGLNNGIVEAAEFLLCVGAQFPHECRELRLLFREVEIAAREHELRRHAAKIDAFATKQRIPRHDGDIPISGTVQR
ncbi:MAG TPA: hypothetical protein VEQ16_07120, partial [Acidocella sp.]|nr:hypothetical protein [Acidocella sp.]